MSNTHPLKNGKGYSIDIHDLIYRESEKTRKDIERFVFEENEKTREAVYGLNDTLKSLSGKRVHDVLQDVFIAALLIGMLFLCTGC